ncbi:MFS transporter [Pelomonas sp. KK5]|uniref:MFS transporter n=1 Tax=Pelomonas sp. KK5 TaxID=1855730 RepID=UPI001E6556EB|nr:MFS transporter [Pelomonas sp. KK5]
MGAPALSRGLLALLAATCGLLVAALYFAQPLTATIAADLGLAPASAGLLVTLTQLGYCAGLVLLTPLGDIVENKRLVLATMTASAGSLALAALAPGGGSFLLASLLVGLSACAVQMLVPLGAHLAAPERRGQVVGTITGGLLLGIMLARPAASSIAGLAGWRAVFGIAAVMVLLAVAVLAMRLQPLRPAHSAPYGSLLASLATVFATQPVLRKRALSHGALFATFSLFWTASPWLLLSQGHTQHDIALFALAGAGGTLIAPLAGRLADRGHTRRVTIAAMATASLAFALSWRGGPMWLLVLAAIAIDAGVQANHVVGQREVLLVDPALRNRLNSVYVAIMFACAALASSMAGLLFHHGWQVVAVAGALLPLLALAIYLAHERGARVSEALR